MQVSKKTEITNKPKPIYLFSTTTHPDAININSLYIKFLKPTIDFSKYDYFIITSKQAIEALKSYDKQLYIKKQALCISHKTAKSFQDIDGRVLDIGDGYGEHLISKITEYPKKTKWLYLRAKVIASDFATRLKNEEYNIDEAILYQSKCSKDILKLELKDDAILIFTSPSGIDCFLKTHTLLPSYKIVVIGQTTAKALPKGTNYKISDETSIQSCIELAKRL